MNYFSTRDSGKTVPASFAIESGLAPDGGLFVPEVLPKVSIQELSELAAKDYRGRAADIMGRFLDEFDAEEIKAFTEAAYGKNFDDERIAPLRVLDENTGVLELWHGPTCAFKDMALQMLPHLLTASIKKRGESREVCILVATSGDTGKAALEGFRDVPGSSILVFYPRDGVSEVQKLQMVTQEGGNVKVCAVSGNFDDAQSGVKRLFSDTELAGRLDEKGWFLSSANSINWGRLLPQIAYYFSAYCDCVSAGMIKIGDKIDFCVPTGNFGNILAGWYAKQMGLPVGKFICASNANNVLTDFISTGVYNRNRPFYTTVSPSMDILISSNLERLLYALSGDSKLVAGYMASLAETGMYQVSEELKAAVTSDFAAGYCDDTKTAETIAEIWKKHGYLIDTHTAVAMSVMEEYREKTGSKTPAVIVSTASPFKFSDSVLKALGSDTDASGAELIPALSKLTGSPAPAPLTGLDKREVRFTDCVDAKDMCAVVENFLS